MIAPYQGPYPCPTCGQGEPEPLDEMQRLGQEFDGDMGKAWRQKAAEVGIGRVEADPQRIIAEALDLLFSLGLRGHEVGKALDGVGQEIASLKAELAEAKKISNAALNVSYVAGTAAHREKDAGVIKELAEALQCSADFESMDGEEFAKKYDDPNASWVSTWDILRDKRKKALARAKEEGY